jgi:hypothetical protein
MSSDARISAGLAQNVGQMSLWPHRLAALLTIVIALNASYHNHLGDVWSTLGIPLLPYVLLEAVGHVPSTRGTKLVFFWGSLCLCAGIVLYAPMFWRGSGEWTRLAFLLIPTLQAVGTIVLGLFLIALRMFMLRE